MGGADPADRRGRPGDPEPGRLLELELDDFLVRGRRERSARRWRRPRASGAGEADEAVHAPADERGRAANRSAGASGISEGGAGGDRGRSTARRSRGSSATGSAAPRSCGAPTSAIPSAPPHRFYGVSGARRVLFVTSNGTGLGHLTRSMAIARRLRSGLEPFFITFSAGAPVVREQGFPVEYIASYDRPGAGTDLSWTFRTRDRLRSRGRRDRARRRPLRRHAPIRAAPAGAALDRRQARLVPAGALARGRRHRAAPSRPPVRRGARAGRARPRRPSCGPTAARRAEARSSTRSCCSTAPSWPPAPRPSAALGLEPGRRNVLVQLGQGAGGARGDARAASAISRRAATCRSRRSRRRSRGSATSRAGVVRSTPTLSDRALLRRVRRRGLGRRLQRMPTSWRRSASRRCWCRCARQTDDQAARAREAERAGLALAVAGRRRPGARVAARRAPRPRAARDAARAAGAGSASGAARSRRRPGVGGSSGQRASAREEGRRRRRRRPSRRAARGPGAAVRLRRAWIFAASVPRTLGRVASQRLRGRARAC